MDYFNQPDRDAAESTPASVPITPNEPFPGIPIEQVLTRQATANAQRSSSYTNLPAIRLRRLQSSSSTRANIQDNHSDHTPEPTVTEEDTEREGRRRSASLPQRSFQRSSQPKPDLRRQATEAAAAASGTAASSAGRATADPLTTVAEERAGSSTPQLLVPSSPQTSRLRGSSNAGQSSIGMRSRASSSASRAVQQQREYDSNIVDVLDVIDPEVSTLNTLNNIQNSLFVPYLGRWLNRRGTYNLSRYSSDSDDTDTTPGEAAPQEPEKPPAQQPEAPLEPIPSAPLEQEDTVKSETEGSAPLKELTHSHTLSSVLSGTSVGHNYAVLPHGTVLEGWTDEDKDELNDYVRHLLHSRRAAFKRKWRGFLKYVSQPLGFLITLWAFLITFWGAAWVLFLIGWIYVGDRQAYFVEICDQILTALFCIIGIGMSPFRAVDTYHMIYIAHYHYLTWRLRKEQALPELTDPNDLPEPKDEDVELARGKGLENPILTPEQQEKLIHHQNKFAQSHTFYKPHETFTHNAFPIKLLITIVVLLDCHSLFQMALGGTTWGIYYKDRPKALTAVILSCSISCNISAGITVSIGDRKSRKKEVVEQIFRQSLTEQAMHKLEKRKGLTTKKREEVKIEEAERERLKQEKKQQKKGFFSRIKKAKDVVHDAPGASKMQKVDEELPVASPAKEEV